MRTPVPYGRLCYQADAAVTRHDSGQSHIPTAPFYSMRREVWRVGPWLHDCFPVKPRHSLVVKPGSSLYIMKMGSWQPTRGFVPVVTLISTYPLLSRLLPNKVTHRPLAPVKGQYKHSTPPLRSLFLTLLLNSNQSVNWVKNNHTEQKNDLLPPSASYAFATSLIRH